MEHAGCAVVEVTGTSDVSVEDAIRSGLGRVGPALEWFEVAGVRSTVLGSAEPYQVVLRVGLRQVLA
ncbi:dodecin domain-containing protein [Pseudonocardia sp. C8]|nr:dodecin domain-containing protein [Pseudonocardia sp. C8]